MFTKYSNRNSQKAFSLVEVVLALGIISFACITLLGLLSMGLVTVSHAVGNTVEAQIIQSVINSSEVQTYSSSFNVTNYFNNEGTQVISTDPTMVYVATVNAIPLTNSTPVSPATPYLYNTASSASLLKVSITNRTQPGAASVFSLVWSNSGK